MRLGLSLDMVLCFTETFTMGGGPGRSEEIYDDEKSRV